MHSQDAWRHLYIQPDDKHLLDALREVERRVTPTRKQMKDAACLENLKPAQLLLLLKNVAGKIKGTERSLNSPIVSDVSGQSKADSRQIQTHAFKAQESIANIAFTMFESSLALQSYSN